MSRKPVEFVIDENNCFICTSHASRKKDGYILHQQMIKGIRIKTYMHRHIYEQCFGEIPDNMLVRHKCDNPMCINPEHLELGTHVQNMHDMVERDRSTKGNKNPQSTLTEDDVRAIRSDKVSTNTSLALKYGVHHSTISAIRRYKLWSHVT